jgi:hypothetical protein
VPPLLRSFIDSKTAGFPDGTIDAIDVYGPGRRAALVKASMGDTLHKPGQGFYLVVFHGQFYCGGCPGPNPLKTPQAAIEVTVWSPPKGETDWGIMKTLQPAVRKLHRLAKVAVS